MICGNAFRSLCSSRKGCDCLYAAVSLHVPASQTCRDSRNSRDRHPVEKDPVPPSASARRWRSRTDQSPPHVQSCGCHARYLATSAGNNKCRAHISRCSSGSLDDCRSPSGFERFRFPSIPPLTACRGTYPPGSPCLLRPSGRCRASTTTCRAHCSQTLQSRETCRRDRR